MDQLGMDLNGIIAESNILLSKLQSGEYIRKNHKIPNGAIIGVMTNVVDGDTIDVLVKHNGVYLEIVVRLAHINAPEMRGGSDRSKVAAKHSRDKLEKYIEFMSPKKLVYLDIHNVDPYKRYISDVHFINNKLGKIDYSVNQWMLDNKYVTPYVGGSTKGIVFDETQFNFL
jgi:endonuclease YncB( thermonuclease family)